MTQERDGSGSARCFGVWVGRLIGRPWVRTVGGIVVRLYVQSREIVESIGAGGTDLLYDVMLGYLETGILETIFLVHT